MTEPALPPGPPESPPPIPTTVVRETPRWRWLIHLFVIGSYPALGLFFRATSGRVAQGPALTGNVRGLLVVSAAEKDRKSVV